MSVKEILSISRNKKAYLVTTDIFTLPVVTERPILLLRNPAGSNKGVFLNSMSFGIEGANAGIARVYRNPTITAIGTIIQPQNKSVGGPASVVDTARGPTISDNGILLFPKFVTTNSRDVPTELFLPPAAIILLTLQISAPGLKVHCDLSWIEL